MGSTRHSSKRLGAPLAFLLGALLSGSAARAQDASTPDPHPPEPATQAATPAPAPTSPAPAAPVEPEITHCGDTQVGTGEGMLRPLGQGFYADGRRVRRGCTLLLQRPLKNRPPVPFAPDSFRPIGCGFFRYATSIYWGRPLSEEDHVNEPTGQRADVLTRVDLADAETFEVDADCRPRDARFFYLNHTERPELPAFAGVPRGDGQGYEELGCGFVRYEGRIFFGARLVEGVHAASFTPVLGRLPYMECGAGMYGKDKSKVWWQHVLLRGAKAKTFRVPKDENPEFRIACNGRRSFQLDAVDKKPNPLCRGAKKPVKKRGK
ncbi:hypothetical protein ACN28E_00930 [Archangium lansingense]|uniref:hypothetical protein n=1 Tax=Archangium lansingense TaxID=2995310 RepID=UPI003B78A192